MSAIIIYGSCYGTASQYAKELSRKTNIPMLSFKDINYLEKYDLIIYVGALYAGGVYGMQKTLSRFDLINNNLIIITVGLANPQDKTNKRNIEKSIKKQLPSNLQYQLFHLRGGIDYSKLSIKHRTMMRLLYHKVKKVPKDKYSEEMEALIKTYNRKVSFVDYKQLDPIISYIEKEVI